MSTAATAQGNSQVRVSDADILRATRLCIDRSGPDRFTMAEVAREAGLTRVQIYNRFGNRDDLVLALLVSHASRFADDLRTTLDAVPDAAPLHGLRCPPCNRSTRLPPPAPPPDPNH